MHWYLFWSCQTGRHHWYPYGGNEHIEQLFGGFDICWYIRFICCLSDKIAA